MNSILAKILAAKKAELAREKEITPLGRLEQAISRLPATRGFASRLRQGNDIALIAEIKKRSPSRGEIRPGLNVADTARAYTRAGAAAISVLADKTFFGGSPEDVKTARQNTPLPLLYKEFVIDPYQLYLARAAGADAALLIVRALSPAMLFTLIELAGNIGLEVLVEVHDEKELELALAAGALVIGINNRDLHTFRTDIKVTLWLRKQITDPRVTIVSESGIRTRQDMLELARHGVHAALVGEALAGSSDPELAAKKLLGKPAGREVV